MEQLNYLQACCRIRSITHGRLINKLIRIIATDQLVLSVLDDAVESR